MNSYLNITNEYIRDNKNWGDVQNVTIYREIHNWQESYFNMSAGGIYVATVLSL